MDTTKDITHISLCAGYGGIDLGLKRAIPSLRTIAFCEREGFCCANLVSKMEAGLLDSAPVWTDLKTFPFAHFRGQVDILTGGFPCQPFSLSGKREGDADPRHLFPAIRDGISVCRPPVVFLENVEGILTSKLQGDGWRDPQGTPVLLHVLRELERLGYKSTAGLFSAAEVGSVHQRKRIFIMAHLPSTRLERYARDIFGEGAAYWGCEGDKRNTPLGCVCGGVPWPSRPGEPQNSWEPPRVTKDKPKMDRNIDGDSGGVDDAILFHSSDNRIDEVRMLGNGCCVPQVTRAFTTLFYNLITTP